MGADSIPIIQFAINWNQLESIGIKWNLVPINSIPKLERRSTDATPKTPDPSDSAMGFRPAFINARNE